MVLPADDLADCVIRNRHAARQAEDSRNEVVFSIIFPTMSSQELIVKSEVDLKQQCESLNYVMHFLMKLIKLRAICNHTVPFR